MRPWSAALALARAMVRLAARRVPHLRRDAFVKEWDGELAAEAESGSWRTVIQGAWGAFADAGTLRRMNREREGTMGGWMKGLGTDVALALRSMRRAPGFTAVTVATLALGLGGSAALYTMLDRVVIQPLPYPQPERLVRLENQVPGVGPNEVWAMSTAQWTYFSEQARTLEAVGLYRASGGNVMTDQGPRRARSVGVTASMMDILGAKALHGRIITGNDDVPEAPAVAVLGYGFWEQVMGADPGTVGTTLTFNDRPVEIIGVMAPGVELPGFPSDLKPDLWLPMRVDRGGTFYSNHVFPGVARMAPGATPESVERELADLTPRLPELFPQAYGATFIDQVGFHTRVTPLKESVLGDLARNLWLLFGGVALVLLIACTNVANLFVVRMEGRRRELNIRAALGAGRSALARYVLAEGLTLAALGGSLALILGQWAVPALTSLAPSDLPRVHGASLSVGAVAYTALLSLLVGVLLAAYPLVTHLRSGERLGGEARQSTSGRPRRRFHSAMVVTQVALAVTLVVGAGVLLQTLNTLRNVDAGVEPEGVLSMDLYLSFSRHGNDEAVWNAYRGILERVRAIPGVAAAGMSEELPVSGGFGCTVQGFEDESVYEVLKDQGLTTCAGQEATSPGYFEAMGIPVLEGRTFTDADNDDPGRAAVVVSKAFADRFWPGRSALGQGVGPNGNTQGPFYHVIGVVGDVSRAATEGEAPLSQPAIAVYYPIRHNPEATWNRNWWPGWISLVVKADVADAASLFPAIRRAVAEVDPEIPLSNLTDMETVVAQATSQLAFVSLLLAIAAATALLLAAVGLYGVISYVVARRTREIGMRLAVGAEPGDVQRMVVAEAMGLVTAGLLLGVALSVAAGRVLRGMVVGVESISPAVYVAGAAVLAVVALVASWLPARRAARIDPVEALLVE